MTTRLLTYAFIVFTLAAGTAFASEVSGTLSAGSNTGNNGSGGSSSEISGSLSSSSSGGTGSGSTLSGTVVGGSGGSSGGGGIGFTSSGSGVNDQVAAQSALLALGPSFTPGAPDAGDLYSTPRNYGAGGGTGEAVIGENDTLVENYLPSYSLLSRYGDEQADSNLAANILSATGLGWPQLLLIALIGIALVGSMGYAMSRTGR